MRRLHSGFSKAITAAGVIVLMAWGAPGQTSGAAAREAVLYRDTWGVPHIFADDLADAAFAMGYAQAEDRVEDIFKHIRTATGTMSEAFGPHYIEQDYLMRVLGNGERCEAFWKTAPPHLRALGDDFVRGVEAYLKKHPERRPDYAVALAGWQAMAVGRAMMIRWPFENLMNELQRKAQAPEFGSNCFAVSPERSAEGCAIFLADPHLRWEGMAVFHEMRVHAGEHEQCGFWLVGSPLPIIGHTGHVAWATTIGGPDTSDVYMVKVNPANPLQYRYNGEWRDFRVEPIRIAVKGHDPVERVALFSVHGPVLGAPDPATGLAYCGATPYFEAMGAFEELHRLSTARSCAEFYEGLAMLELMEMNLLFADTAGTIQYVRNGRTPIRPDGCNWSVPVPGDTDATRWLGFHAIGDLVQTKNPPQGYYQNCNVSPGVMYRDSEMTRDKYIPYIYNVTWDMMTPRGARLLELLDADASVTLEEAKGYALDVYDILATKWQDALRRAVENAGQAPMAEPEFAKAVDTILAWDGCFTRESAAAPIIRYWRAKCDKVLPVVDMADGKPLDRGGQAILLDKLAETLAEMKAKYGTLDLVWGDVNLVGRGGRYFGCPGVEFGGWNQKSMTETVMDVGGAEEPPGSGRFVANSGSSSVLLSFLRPSGIESYSLVNWGQSGDPHSPHYLDQAEKLYVERQFKPTWFQKAELMRHVESETVLTVE